MADDWVEGRAIFLSRVPWWIFPPLFLGSCLITSLNKISFLLGAITTAVFVARLLITPGLTERLLWFRLLEHLRGAGLVSYSLYLLHEPFIALVPTLLGPFFRNSNGYLFLASLLEWPLVLAISWGFYRILELPSIAWGKDVARRFVS